MRAFYNAHNDTRCPHAGIPVKWTNNGFVKPGSILGPNPIPPQIIHHAALIGDLAAKARVTMRRLLGAEDGDLQLLRLHTQSNEIIISPTEETTLVVVQKAHQGPQLTIVEVADWEQARMAADAAAKKKT